MSENLRTLNGNEQLPETFYVFVGGYNSITQHNFRITGTFSSSSVIAAEIDPEFRKKYIDGTATYAPFTPTAPSCPIHSPYLLTAVNDYRVEYDAERYRYQYYPIYPSRLSAVYAFGDKATCEIVAKKYNWNLSSASEFVLVKSDLTRVVKVNMEIVSVARAAYKMSSLDQENIDLIWQAYWEGRDKMAMEIPNGIGGRQVLKAEPVWEYLIDGVIVRKAM